MIINPKKTYYLIYYLMVICLLPFLTLGCNKEGPVELPTMGSFTISDITDSSAVISGSLEYDGGSALSDMGVVWNTTDKPSLTNHEGKISTGSGGGHFTITITELSAGTSYHVRGYATNSEGTAYSTQINFTTTGTAVVEVFNPVTGRTWMDRNLGARRAATSSTDVLAYGHLYQWGRVADGHQIRTSNTTSTLSNSDTPGHGNFIISSIGANWDWRSPQNDNLWQGVNGVNNPCPTGFRLPTPAEWDEERQSWISNSSVGAFASPLKLPFAGYRNRFGWYMEGSQGYYWSGAVDGNLSQALFFEDCTDAFNISAPRAYGMLVRCIKDSDISKPTYSLDLKVSPWGSGVVDGSSKYTEGTIITITAIADACYLFLNWTGDIAYLSNACEASTTITMPAYDISLTANFKQHDDDNCDWPRDTDTEVVEVTNPATGKIWMDRNLGANRVATESTDWEAYGHLYQWGRAADGHQRRTSGTTSTLSNSYSPGHGNFILAPNCPRDWRSPQNDNLWQGVNGINNPCPTGFRLPTPAEWDAESQSWSSYSSVGAFASPLKLPVAGSRLSSGSSFGVDYNGYYWSSTVDGKNSRYLSFYRNRAGMSAENRAAGMSVRCIKDSDISKPTYSLDLKVSPWGSGVVDGSGKYAEGSIVGITARANEDYIFIKWTGDINYLSNAGATSTTVSMPAYDISLSANFEQDYYENVDWPRDTDTEVVEVTNPATGKTWMDRNLGASRAATSSTDAQAYGHLYQWGRATDGHQIRTSSTTSTRSSNDTPGHGNFIFTPDGPNDWRSPQNDNLWRGVNGVNNPCPTGFRLPTPAELDADRQSWSSDDAAGAFASPLKLPLAGSRSSRTGSLVSVGSNGFYWSSTSGFNNSLCLIVYNDRAGIWMGSVRADGNSVRCIKD